MAWVDPVTPKEAGLWIRDFHLLVDFHIMILYNWLILTLLTRKRLELWRP